jgi:hypothetical protein
MEALVVGVEAVGHHVRALLHQLDLLGHARRRDPVLDHGVPAAGLDRVGQLLPAVEVDARQLAPVGLDLVLEVVDAVVVADRGTGVDGVDVLLADRRRVLDRGHVRVARP